MNSRYYDLRGKIVKAESRIAILTERGEMWEQYNQYKSIHKQLAKVKPEKREQFEQRHSRELILYDAATRYLKDLKMCIRDRTGTALKDRKPRRIYGTLCWVHTPTFWKIRLLEMTVT